MYCVYVYFISFVCFLARWRVDGLYTYDIRVCMYAYMYISFTLVWICMYVCMYVCMCVNMLHVHVLFSECGRRGSAWGCVAARPRKIPSTTCRRVYRREKRTWRHRCMDPHIHTYIHTYIYTYMHTQLHMQPFVYSHMIVSIIHTYIPICTYNYIHTHLLHTYTRTYYTYIHTYINTYIYIIYIIL